jgi:hypothetical protein
VGDGGRVTDLQQTDRGSGPIPSRIASTPSLPSGMLVTTGRQAFVLLAYGLRVPGYTGLATGHHVP